MPVVLLAQVLTSTSREPRSKNLIHFNHFIHVEMVDMVTMAGNFLPSGKARRNWLGEMVETVETDEMVKARAPTPKPYSQPTAVSPKSKTLAMNGGRGVWGSSKKSVCNEWGGGEGLWGSPKNHFAMNGGSPKFILQ